MCNIKVSKALRFAVILQVLNITRQSIPRGAVLLLLAGRAVDVVSAFSRAYIGYPPVTGIVIGIR